MKKLFFGFVLLQFNFNTFAGNYFGPYALGGALEGGGDGSVTKTEVYPLPVERFYQVITDYESYPEFIDKVVEVRIIQDSEDAPLVEYTLSIVKQFTYQLRMSHQEPHRVSWTFHSGDLFDRNDGSWELEDLGDGRTRVTYTLDVDFGWFVPQFIANTVASRDLPQLFESLYRRARELEQ